MQEKGKGSSGLFQELVHRLIYPLGLLVGVTGAGTLGYWLLGGGRWSLLDSLYMTSITITTVGYGEVLENMDDRSRVFSMVLMWAGMGIALYAVSAVTAFVVEQRLSRYFREKRMEREIARLAKHIIVCGAGRTGENIIREFLAVRQSFCVIEQAAEEIRLLGEAFPGVLLIQGDATEEGVLEKAGIHRASGLIANLGDDSRNLLITVTARYLRQDLRIVARAQDTRLAPKLKRAGADYVVNPALIGGLRMASEILRPHVVTFLDRMLRGADPSIRVDEVTIGEKSSLDGVILGEASLRERTGLAPIAIRGPGASEFTYNLGNDTKLEVGTTLIVIGNPGQLAQLRALCGLG